jgi:hypothetical protein
MFKTGEKVVCINDSCGKLDGVKLLEKGEIYVIEKVFSLNSKSTDLLLYGFDKGWDSSRFKKLDYEFAENLLAEITKEVAEKGISEFQLS